MAGTAWRRKNWGFDHMRIKWLLAMCPVAVCSGSCSPSPNLAVRWGTSGNHDAMGGGESKPPAPPPPTRPSPTNPLSQDIRCYLKLLHTNTSPLPIVSSAQFYQGLD
jgi:hypothetical protein